jgi:hypothetical protein
MASLIHFRKQSEREFDSVSFTGMVCFTHGQSINKNSPPPLLLFCFCAARLYTSYAGRLRMCIYIYIYLWWHLWFYSIVEGLCTASRRNKERVGWGVICCATTNYMLRDDQKYFANLHRVLLAATSHQRECPPPPVMLPDFPTLPLHFSNRSALPSI